VAAGFYDWHHGRIDTPIAAADLQASMPALTELLGV
jgi:branched-chain amino acid transport system ATP-binding protein